MKTIIVMPCLNEERVLLDACRSLGFGVGQHVPGEATLVLVDNGSTDDTHRVMEQVRDASLQGAVVLEYEEERGYAPPRHKGAMKARELAAQSGLSEDQILVVQADADTDYAPGYVSIMSDAARGLGAGVLLEGATLPTPAFASEHAGFVALSDEVDRSVNQVFVSEEDDVIVGDSVSAYRLSDYVRWGGHSREYNAAGDEIFAETSRLYIKGKLLGARRVKLDAAIAYPSRRKVLEDPGLYFATAGFPREMEWRARWRSVVPEVKPIGFFDRDDARTIFAKEIELRLLHLAIVFGVIPQIVASAGGRVSDKASESPLSAFVRSKFGTITAERVRANTGVLIGSCLEMIEHEPATLLERLA